MIHQLLNGKPGTIRSLSPDHVIMTQTALDALDKKNETRIPLLFIDNRLPLSGGPAGEKISGLLQRGARYYPPGRSGMPAMVCAEEGFAAPGVIMAGTDKNLLELAVFGTWNIYLEAAAAADLLKKGKLDIAIPGSFGIFLKGKPGTWVSGIDIALHILKYYHLPEDRSVCLEIYGDGLQSLPLNERLNMARILIDLGYEHLLFQVDETILAFLQDRCEVKGQYYFREDAPDLTVDLSDIHLLQAVLRSGELQIENVGHAPDIHVDQIFIGGDTACRYDDFEKGLKMIRYTLLPELLGVYILPGSQLVCRDLLETGIAGIFTEIGMEILPSAFLEHICACPDTARIRLGTSCRILRSGGILAGTGTCFNAAVTGKIMHPQELEFVLKEKGRLHRDVRDDAE
ncbi:MAG: hypothetical protein K0B52_01120 [FCB group bacterium]|nr:hypothetical protein [FCB group bacterium]